jgi:hypothetical protein
VSVRVKKVRCQNYIDKSPTSRCWNIATNVAVIQHTMLNQQQRVWICDGCFKLRFLNDKEFSDQLLQVINLSKNN